MDELELAWAAGFYDGEGHSGQHGTYIYVSVSQKDRRPLDRFVAAVGVGRVLGPYEVSTPPRKDGSSGISHIYHWRVCGRKANKVLWKLWPHLSEPKREQVKKLDCVLVEKIAA